jgi:predicted dehydrogenase
MSEPIRLALVGTGLFAQDAHLPALQTLGDRFQIVAVYSRSRANAEALAAQIPGSPQIYTDLDVLLANADVEAVDVILPIEVLPDAVEKSLQAGKHVISEKPLAPDVATGRHLIQTYNRASNHQVWMIAENYRYEESFRRAGAVVRSGEIGALVLAEWTLLLPTLPGNKYYGTDWRRSGTCSTAASTMPLYCGRLSAKSPASALKYARCAPTSLPPIR